jgi:cell division protein FtsB
MGSLPRSVARLNRDEYSRFWEELYTKDWMVDKIKNYKKVSASHLAQLRDLRVVGLLLFLVIVLLVSWSGVKAIETNYGLQKQISGLRQENRVRKLANENIKLENEYFNTSQYLEIAARHDFGLAAKGETVLNVPRQVALSYTVDLSPPEKTEEHPAAKQPAYQRNFQAWMDFLLHRRADSE